MSKNSFLSRIFVICILWILTSCASTGETRSAGTLFLGEVSFILTKDQIMADQLGHYTMKDFYKSLLAEGVTDKEIDAGQVVAIQGSIYWANTASGIKHKRITVALLPKGMEVEPGNIVELRDPGGVHFYAVERIRAQSLGKGQCSFVEALAPPSIQVTKDILGIFSLIGSPGSATLYCKGIEDEGWEQNHGYWVKHTAFSLPQSK
jgi:hypothetical protein